MSDTIRALLTGAVDYAGLFPPAQLSMREAVERYASYRTSADAWMLGRLVLPAARLTELAGAAAGVARSGAPWLLSVILDDPAGSVSQIVAFNREHTLARCDVVEARATLPGDVGNIAAAVRETGLRAYVEVPVAADPAQMIAAIAREGLCAKIRTGGVVESAIPRASDVVRFLACCLRAGVPFKATAGLHHPVRGEYRLTYETNSPAAVMYGYLNMFLAAALLYNGGSEQDATALLELRDASSLRVDGEGARWNGLFIPASSIAAFRRDALAGFGSCSFTEPVEEIAALGFV